MGCKGLIMSDLVKKPSYKWGNIIILIGLIVFVLGIILTYVSYTYLTGSTDQDRSCMHCYASGETIVACISFCLKPREETHNKH